VPGPAAGSLRRLYAVTFASFAVVGLYLAALQRYVTTDLGGGEAAVGVAIGSFGLSALLFRPFLGRGVDRRGRRPFLLGACLLLAAVSLGFVVVGSVAAVVALRLVQGAAQAAVYVTVASMVVDLAPPERRGAAVARFSLFLYAGLGLGPPLAEWLIPRLGFDATWLAAVVLHLLALAAASQVAETADLPDPASTRPPFQLLHPAALRPGIVLLFPAVGYASIVGFATLYADAIGMGTASGALYTAFAATIIIVRLGSGDLADRFGVVTVTWPGILSAGAGLAVLALTSGIVAAFAGVVLFGIGFALIFPALLSLAVGRGDPRQRGEVVGSFTAFADLGIGGGAYLIGAIVAAFGFDVAFGVAAAGCVLSAIGLRGLGARS
jgi:predicted MFS family arabinose efflux permease